MPLPGSFDSRFWIPITSILLRLWQGTGFCHPQSSGNDCSSSELQRCFRASAHRNRTGINAFLNHIFNNLNWTVTEFHVALKEIEDAAKNRLSADLRDLQRKCDPCILHAGFEGCGCRCNITFELSTHLFRVLELLTLEACGAGCWSELEGRRLMRWCWLQVPGMFLGSEDVNLSRLMEMVSSCPHTGLQPADAEPSSGLCRSCTW